MLNLTILLYASLKNCRGRLSINKSRMRKLVAIHFSNQLTTYSRDVNTIKTKYTTFECHYLKHVLRNSAIKYIFILIKPTNEQFKI